jgi:hypothetical protein
VLNSARLSRELEHRAYFVNVVLSYFFLKLELSLCTWFVESLIDETKKHKVVLEFLDG